MTGRLKVLLGICAIAVIGFLCHGCSEVDYQLYHTSYCMVRFYDASGDSISISDSLQITADGTDSVLVSYKQGYGVKTIYLPLSYNNNKDVFHLSFKNGTTVNVVDLTVNHENWMHFENADNQPCAYHQISTIEVSPTNLQVKSASVTKAEVTYDRSENIQLLYEDISSN